eukprot:scaffold3042_cov127-Skeletonema_dohrnii-CCMP3373.AAC.22
MVLTTNPKEPATDGPPSGGALALDNNCFHAILHPFPVNQLPTRPAIGSERDKTSTDVRATVAGNRKVDKAAPRRK